MTLSGSRQDTWITYVTLAGVSLGPWDQFSGGEVDSEETKYRPAGYDQEISLGGRKTFTNVTTARYWDDWIASIYRWLQRCVGQQRGFIQRVPFTADWIQVGAPQGYGGTLKRVAAPEVDSMGNDAALVEMEFTIDTIS